MGARKGLKVRFKADEKKPSFKPTCRRLKSPLDSKPKRNHWQREMGGGARERVCVCLCVCVCVCERERERQRERQRDRD